MHGTSSAEERKSSIKVLKGRRFRSRTGIGRLPTERTLTANAGIGVIENQGCLQTKST
jgi:hypothetical protein